MASRKAEDMRTKYYELLAIYSKNKLQHSLMRKEWVDSMIKKITAAKEILNNEGTHKLSKGAQFMLENYDVTTYENKRSLVKKSKPIKPDTKTIRKVVIPFESSFETILDSHLSTTHGSASCMEHWIEKKNLAVAKLCVPILHEVCLSMNKDCCKGYVKGLNTLPLNREIPRSTKDNTYVTIMDMTLQPDHSFQYLLVYKDLKTQFVQLRPLTATDFVDEIAMEMMKLFCDFSPPKVIMVDKELKSIFEAVLDRLNSVFHEKTELAVHDNLSLDPRIEKKLTNWMLSNKSSNWSAGCHIVQWNLNNASAESNSAFQKFFGIDTDYIKRKSRRKAKKGKYSQTKSTPDTTSNARNDAASQNEITKSVARDTVIQNNQVKKFPNTIAVKKFKMTREVTNTGDMVHPELETYVFVQAQHDDEIDDESDDEGDDDTTHFCNTCELVIQTKVYSCCACKSSLHLYCGASKLVNGKMESVCFTCL